MKINLETNEAFLENGMPVGEVVKCDTVSVRQMYDKERKYVMLLEILIKDAEAYRNLVMFEPPEDKLQTRKVTVHDSSTEENAKDWVDIPGN